jgi:hypothetical protein
MEFRTISLVQLAQSCLAIVRVVASFLGVLELFDSVAGLPAVSRWPERLPRKGGSLFWGEKVANSTAPKLVKTRARDIPKGGFR